MKAIRPFPPSAQTLVPLAALVLAALLVLQVAHCQDAVPAGEVPEREMITDGEKKLVVGSSGDNESRVRVFNFKQFKTLFHKSYATIGEELRRQTLFLSNLLQSVNSYLKYKRKSSSSFRAVNDMSDWTQEEFRESLMDTRAFLKDLETSGFDFAQVYADEDEAEESEDLREVEEVDNDLETGQAGGERRRVGGPVGAPGRRTLGELLANDEDDEGYESYGGPKFKAELGRQLRRMEAHRERNLEKLESLDSERAEQLLEDEENLLLSIRDDESEHVDETRKKSSKGKSVKQQLTGGVKKVGKALIKGFGATDAFVEDHFRKIYTGRPEYRPDLPDEVFTDHRQLGCLTPVKSQGRCGSCYIFSTLALYEWAYCKREGKQVEFSEQYVMDCWPKMKKNKACEGGFAGNVADFIKKFGLELSKHYRYQAKQAECPYKSAGAPRDAMGFVRMDKPALELVGPKSIERQLAVSPVIVSISPARDMHQYGGGVDEGKNCGEDWLSLHSMLLVGSGRQDGHEYWVMRNSWGRFFGEHGYYRVRKDSKCLAHYGFGLTLERLRKTKKGIKGLVGREAKRAQKTARDVYEFFANPKHDWRILAARFDNALGPPTLPKAEPVAGEDEDEDGEEEEEKEE